jgi:hypothetical protein
VNAWKESSFSQTRGKEVRAREALWEIPLHSREAVGVDRQEKLR